MNTRRFSMTDSQLPFALVIDETRVVAADTGVDHRLLVDDEQEGVVVAFVVVS
jgi:hypothetical protein